MMSSTPPDSFPRPRGAPAATARPARKIPWLPLLLISAVVLATYAYFEGPREIGRWYIAAADEYWTEAEYATLRGESSRATENQNRAFASLEQALKWAPIEPNYILQ